jgi:hypothetical protein
LCLAGNLLVLPHHLLVLPHRCYYGIHYCGASALVFSKL